MFYNFLAIAFQFRFSQIRKFVPPFILYVSKQSISNSFSKCLLGKGGGNVKSSSNFLSQNLLTILHSHPTFLYIIIELDLISISVQSVLVWSTDS